VDDARNAAPHSNFRARLVTEGHTLFQSIGRSWPEPPIRKSCPDAQQLVPTLSDPRRRPTAGAWTRAARTASAATDAIEALTGILAEAVPALGSQGAAVLEQPGLACRAAWGVDPATLPPLPRPAPSGEDRAAGEYILLDRPERGTPWPSGADHIAVLPLRLRGVDLGSLALLFGPGDLPSKPVLEVATGFAALAALVLEADRLYEEAREARQARDHFLTALNHELRTPATAFILTADLLRGEPKGVLPDRLDRLLRDADAHVQQLIGVLRRVLDLGKLGSQANPESVDLLQPRDLVAELMRRAEPTARRKNLTLSLYLPRTLPPLQSDGSRLSRIILHLLGNAIKYTAQGGVEVRLERGMQPLSRPRPEPVLVVRVKDTGRGIPPGELERIFEPFAQVDEGARSDSVERGQGLGLPLARRLARSLGGDVQVESVLDGGTTATLVIPYRQRGNEES
jgi:signal transduction histidine kinase